MTHQPRTLALLISLVGASVPSGAHASIALVVPAATTLDAARWTGSLIWHGNGDTPEFVAPALHALAEEPLAQEPGTASVHPEPDVRPIAPQAGPSVDGRPQRMRQLFKAIGSKFGVRLSATDARTAVTDPAPAAPSRQAGGATATNRPIEPTADGRPAAAVRFAVGESATHRTIPASTHAEGLMQSLDAVLGAGLRGLSRDELLSRVVERFPAAVATPPSDEPVAPAPPVVESRPVIVATQADKVLRNLESVLSKDTPAAAAAPAMEPDEIVVATQAERVLATLLEVSTARRAGEQLAAQRRASESLEARTAQTSKRATLAPRAALLPSTPPAPALEAMSDLAPADIDLGILLPSADAVAVVEHSPAQSPFGTQKFAVAESSLDRVRGGFVTNGLNISFGIERAVYVNGALVTSTTLNMSELGRISAGRGTTALDPGTLALIQSGGGNAVSVGSISPTSIGTVVQNTLDGQKIQNLTIINATANSLGVLRGLNLQSSLRGAVIDSLRR